MNAEMKANRIVFRKIKQQYDLMIMKSAVILADMDLNFDKEQTFEDNITFMKTVEEVPVRNDARGLRYQIKALEELKVQLLGEEKYEEVIEADEILVKLRKELKRLKNGI